jgi:opacity protein-like surface antigen
MRWMQIAAVAAGLAMLGGTAAVRAQTDVGLSFYGAFNGTTSGNNTAQSPSNAAGGLIELRHISNPLMGFEVTYAFNRANQAYSYTGPVPAGSVSCPSSLPNCIPGPVSVHANAHELTADWLVSLKLANLRPFGLAGVGLLLDSPTSGQSNTSSSTKPVFVYGAGIDWGLLPHLGLRFQYRGNLYKAPDLTSVYRSTDAFTHTAEPMIGAYFRF